MMLETTLPSICHLVTDGTHDSPKLQPAGIPFIKGKHISSGYIDFDNCDYITEKDHEKCIKRVKPQVGDVLFSNIGSVGDTALVNDNLDFSIKNVALFRPNPDKVDSKYFYYLIKSPQFRESILNLKSGAAQPFITLEIFRQHKFFYNSNRNTQEKTAAVLSGYDDLIENNLKRIALLEKSARLLYEEWFVRLRFPGFEHANIVDGVPEGWEKKKAYDVMDIMSGGTPKTSVSHYYDGDIPFYTPKDSKKNAYVFNTLKTLTEEGLKNCNSKLYPKDTLFITARGTVGNLNLAQCPMAMNQSCYALKGKPPVSQKYLYCVMQAAIEYIQKHAVGAVFDAIVVDTFKQIPFILPEAGIIKAFEESVMPLFAQTENLLLQNQKLKQARDILLPRLIHGEIAV